LIKAVCCFWVTHSLARNVPWYLYVGGVGSACNSVAKRNFTIENKNVTDLFTCYTVQQSLPCNSVAKRNFTIENKNVTEGSAQLLLLIYQHASLGVCVGVRDGATKNFTTTALANWRQQWSQQWSHQTAFC
jgi:hypothetical protein